MRLLRRRRWRAGHSFHLPLQILQVADVHLAAAGHDDVAGLLVALACPQPFGLDGRAGGAVRGSVRQGRAAFLLGRDLGDIGAVEIAGHDAMRGDGARSDLADGIDDDGVAYLLHVLLRAHVFGRIVADRAHHLVGLGVDAMLHDLRRKVAAFERDLDLPQARFAGRQIEGRCGRGAEGDGRGDGEAVTHQELAHKVSPVPGPPWTDSIQTRACSYVSPRDGPGFDHL